MKPKTGKIITIRFVYVILFFIILMVGVLAYLKYSANNKIRKLADNKIEVTENSSLSDIGRGEAKKVTSRGEELSRTKENEEIAQENDTEKVEKNSEAATKNKISVAEAVVSEEITQTQKEEKETVSIQEVKIAKDMDLTVRTGLSREDFITLIAGVKADTSGFFEQNAGIIYDLCKEYSLNEIFFCGLISAESGWNIAQNHRNTHNYISLMSNGKLIQYPSVEIGLREAARKLHTNYLTKGGKFYCGKTLVAVKTKFCPESSTWVSLVYGRMSQIIK